MVAPLAYSLDELVKSDRLKKEELGSMLKKMAKTMTYGLTADRPTEVPVTRLITDSFLVLLALRLTHGDAEKTRELINIDQLEIL